MVAYSHHPSNMGLFIKKALKWASAFDSACCLNSNGYPDRYGQLSCFIAAGEKARFIHDGTDTFSKLQGFIDANPNTWLPGFLSYDLKNEIEALQTNHPDTLQFPDAYFFVPEHILLIGKYNIEISSPDPENLIKSIENTVFSEDEPFFPGELKLRMSKDQYLDVFHKLQGHIHRGDIYEVNLCQEFYAEQVRIDPVSTYLKLNELSPTPFSCYFKYQDRYIISASPERFLLKQGQQLVAQPIKGTAPRSPDALKDQQLKDQLRANHKEIAENMMIVDLVRNDLTRSAEPGSVQTSNLLEVHSYRQVHQLVSTVSCRLKAGLSAAEALKNTFPAGSMTGAPKISAMQLIDRYENSRRSIYSGAVGYFSPQGDFDFNVVIRTILYNAVSGLFSFHTGGAITAQATAEEEYNECLIKGKAILDTIGKRITPMVSPVGHNA